MIELSQVSKVYQMHGKPMRALDKINLQINKGEIFGVLGKSGAGKSTLLRCVNLLERPTEGQVTVDGQSMCDMTTPQLLAARHRIGMIFQHFNLLESRDAFANVALPMQLMHLDKQKIKAKVEQLLELVGLSERMHHYPRQLSGGQKQRVAIARALATDPHVLLCDEATSALDTESTHAILDLLYDIRQRLGITIMLITHELEVVKKICDRVSVIDGGHIIECGRVIDVFSNPQTAVARQLLHPPLDLQLPQREDDERQSVFVKLEFIAENSDKPVITDLIRHHNIEVNILRASIENIQSTPFGYTVCELLGTPSDVEQAMNYLKQQEIAVEVLT
ncbi:MAG: ATP-binding cassette domain-containing protein [Coxiellaceae bacterium]|nr:ATP-binding cassette domain-containing protein [Coxiellaceae bacterium]